MRSYRNECETNYIISSIKMKETERNENTESSQLGRTNSEWTQSAYILKLSLTSWTRQNTNKFSTQNNNETEQGRREAERHGERRKELKTKFINLTTLKSEWHSEATTATVPNAAGDVCVLPCSYHRLRRSARWWRKYSFIVCPSERRNMGKNP